MMSGGVFLSYIRSLLCAWPIMLSKRIQRLVANLSFLTAMGQLGMRKMFYFWVLPDF